MWCHNKSVSLIFKEPIKSHLHRFKHEYFMHRDTKPRSKRASRCQDIHAPLAPAEAWKSTSRACVAERFRPWPSIKGVCAVWKHAFSGLRCRAILALAVDPVYLGGPETRICTGKSSADAEILVLQGRTTHRNQCIHILCFKVARYFLADP